jgi:hypothetical protein
MHTANESRNFLNLSLLVEFRCFACILTLRRKNQYIPSKDLALFILSDNTSNPMYALSIKNFRCVVLRF